ncbi:MAG: hypothetical protein ACJ8C4_08590 [Gemmataceae bacterium]
MNVKQPRQTLLLAVIAIGILVMGFLYYKGTFAVADAPSVHPLANAKVGDTVTYKSVGDGPLNRDITIKKTVVAKSGDTVTLKIDTTMGTKTTSNELVCNLNQKYDRAQMKASPNEANKTGEGKTKLTIGGKDYECTWIEEEIKFDDYVSKEKIWFCNDVPLDGMVKHVSDHGMFTMTIEMVEAAHRK